MDPINIRDNEHEENHMCCFSKNCSFKRTSVSMEKKQQKFICNRLFYRNSILIISIFMYHFDDSNNYAWLLLKKLHPKNLTYASLYIFRRSFANSDLETYDTPSTRGFHIKNLMTYTWCDSRTTLLNILKLKTNFICNKYEKDFLP